MKNLLATILLLMIFHHSSFCADTTFRKTDDQLVVLKQNVLNDILSATVKEADVMKIAGTMKEDGSWANINYADKTRGGWTVADHLSRLESMAILYTRSGSKWKGDEKLKQKILLGLDFWFKNDFICPNWWYPEIGVPKILGPTMLLMQDKLTADETKAGLKILDRAKIGMTGQNKVWLSGNVIYRSLLTDQAALIRSAVKAIQEEVVVSDGEGIQADNSFHQHGPQQQFGNYGAAFALDMLKWATIFQNTPFQFDGEKVEILRNYLLNGMRWIVWKNKMDISACGRQLFPNAQAGKAKNISNVFGKMPAVDPVYKQQYLQAMNDFAGNKHFWRSDMTVHRRKDFYTSVKMASNRVAGAESCNSENVQGYHLGDGATYFYQSNHEYDDIFPFWDWKMIPGTTTFHDAEPLPVLPCSGYRIESDFVGGVSDGMNGVATLAYNRDKLKAQKSYFYFDDAIICIGSGIATGENKEVRTAINQSFLHGNVMVKQNAGPKAIEKGDHNLQGVSWILHDNWGYYFPGKETVQMANREQNGQWNYLLKRVPPKDIKANIFTLYVNHHDQPKDASYAYFVFPAATVANIEKRAAEINIIQNSKRLQAVEQAQKQLAGFVFVEAGEATTKTFKTINVSQPCVLMASKKANSTQITLADPTHKLNSITIGLEGKKKSEKVPSTYDTGRNMTFFTVALPQAGEAGKSTSFTAL